jgi:D-alanyl-D-alanine carboxypeptidase/D-alanyl-D-alanine-endopeptidase (penicillin-binding protein 4)
MNYLFSEEILSIDHAMVGIYAVNMETSEVILNQNSDLSFMPASCMKLITTAAALHILGSATRFETNLQYDGIINSEKTLVGNIYIQGGGDPLLGSKRIEGWQSQINLWVDEIKKLGIKKIAGKIISDSSKWEKAMASPSWLWEDLGNYYGSGASALSFYENSYDLTFKGGKAVLEKTSVIKTNPPLKSLIIQNEVTTGPARSGDRACLYGSEFSFTQYVRGTIPLDADEFTIKGAIPDPGLAIEELLREKLEAEQITLLSETINSKSPRITIHTTYSPPIEKIVYWTNQDSVNLYAEHLLKKMGEVSYNDGSTQGGIKATIDFLTSLEIDTSGFHMADGSGLSRKNLITPKQMVLFLLKLKKSPYFPLFYESLPLIDDSIKAKSGSMAFCKGYAGYSKNIAFAIFINNSLDPSLRNEKLDKFFKDLAIKP